MEQASSLNIQTTLRDILHTVTEQKAEFRQYVDEHIDNFVSQAKHSVASEVKKLKAERDITWRREGNKIQFSFNADLLDVVTQTKWAIDNKKEEYASELLLDIEKKLSQRNKLIKLADSSEGGWETVRQYEAHPIASDSDDDTRITRAETRALRKRKRTQDKFKKSTRFASGNPNPGFGIGAPFGMYAGTPFASFTGNMAGGGPLHGPRQRFRPPNQPGGSCFSCGAFNHYRRDCPFNRSEATATDVTKHK